MTASVLKGASQGGAEHDFTCSFKLRGGQCEVPRHGS